MKVKDLLDRMMMSSTIDNVTIYRKGTEIGAVSRSGMLHGNYSGLGYETVTTFAVLNRAFVVNVK